MMKNKVYCDKCKKNFKIDLKEEILDDKNQVVRTYFSCPHCKTSYDVSVIDARIRGWMTQLQDLQRKINKREDSLMKKYLS